MLTFCLPVILSYSRALGNYKEEEDKDLWVPKQERVDLNNRTEDLGYLLVEEDF